MFRKLRKRASPIIPPRKTTVITRLILIDTRVLFDENSIVRYLKVKQRVHLSPNQFLLPEMNSALLQMLQENSAHLSSLATGRNLKIAFVCPNKNNVKINRDKKTRFFRLVGDEWIEEMVICHMLTSRLSYLIGCFTTFEFPQDNETSPLMRGLTTFLEKNSLFLNQAILFATDSLLIREAEEGGLPIFKFRKRGELDQHCTTRLVEKIMQIQKFQPEKKIIISLDIDDTILIVTEPNRFEINPYLVSFLADLIRQFSIELFHFIVLSSRMPDALFAQHFPDYVYVTTQNALRMLQETLAPYIGGNNILIRSKHIHCMGELDSKTNQNIVKKWKIEILNYYFKKHGLPIVHVEDKIEENNLIHTHRTNEDISTIQVYCGGELHSNASVFYNWLLPKQSEFSAYLLCPDLSDLTNCDDDTICQTFTAQQP